MEVLVLLGGSWKLSYYIKLSVLCAAPHANNQWAFLHNRGSEWLMPQLPVQSLIGLCTTIHTCLATWGTGTLGALRVTLTQLQLCHVSASHTVRPP